MPSILSTTAFVALLTAVSASPVEKRGVQTISQVSKGTYFKSGPIEISRAFSKFSKPIPGHIAQAARAAASNGSVSADPLQFDVAYICAVTAGKSELELDFDTGSSDLWVFSSLQPSSQTSGHGVYNVASGKQLPGSSWNIRYGDGSGAAGKVYADKVVIGGVTATSQAVEAATSISTQFQQDKEIDGLVGLAFSSINTVKPKQQLTFFDNVKSSLAQPLFAADLRKGAAGSYDFGFIDKSKFKGDLAYTNIDSSQGFWTFTADKWAVGNVSGTGSVSGIADTGTTLLLLPNNIVTAYYKGVRSAKNDQTQGGFVFNCNEKLPDFSITVAGQVRTVPGSFVNFAPIDQTGATCFGGIQSSDGIGINIFGDIFLKSQYVVFEAGSGAPRIGFGQKV
jgi:aspergillopepsin I